VEKIGRVSGAELDAGEAREGSEQPRRKVAMLLRKEPIAQHQGLRAQSIKNIDSLEWHDEALLKPLRAVAGHSTK
jgi:hypothetical protein